MPVLTRRLALVALALAALRYLLPDDLPGGLLLLDGALVVAVILDFALGTAPGRVEVDRRAPSVVVVGQRAPLRWTVRNPGDRPLLVSVADDLASSLHAEQRRFSVEVPARGAATVETELVPSRRGRFEPSQLVVRTRGPLGLMERQRTRRQHATIRVHPPFRSKGEAELLVNRARVLEVGLRSARGRGGGTDFDQLRDYGPDDEFRRIDWAATARAGHPIVRTYRAERNQTVLTLLDAGRLMAARVEGVPRLEHAMDATMVLATVATRVGDRFGLVTFSEEVRTVLEPSKQRAHAGKVTEALYDLEPELVESDYRKAFTATVARFRRRSLLVLLTDLSEPAAEEFLLPAMGLLTSRHEVVIGAVRDPQVEAWAAGRTGEADAATATYLRAAALGAIEERRRVASRFRALGATVVDAAPGRLAVDLADTYLHMKAVGAL